MLDVVERLGLAPATSFSSLPSFSGCAVTLFAAIFSHSLTNMLATVITR